MSMHEELNKLRIENLMLLAKVNERQATRMIQNRAEIVRLLQSIGVAIPAVSPKPVTVDLAKSGLQYKPECIAPAPVVNPAMVAAAMTAGW